MVVLIGLTIFLVLKNANNKNNSKNLKKIFHLGDNESVNTIQVSLAFSQEAMQNKKKIKDNRKKIPPQNQKEIR